MNVQETIANVSENSNECDNPERMQKSGAWYGHVQKMQDSGVQLKESIGQSSCFVPHGKRLHNSTFNSQPVTPLVSLSQIQEHILSHSDIERRRLQYDNAWDILENEDSRLSNHYKPSVTTKKSNTSYVFVGSVQKASREVKLQPTPFSGQTDDTSRYSGDSEDYKSKSKRLCSMKKICKYLLWILIFLGVSAVVAMITVNNQNSQPNPSVNSMEALAGNNEINKMLTSILEKLDSIKISMDPLKTLSEENTTPKNAGVGSGTDSVGDCYNSTTNGCVDQCYDICNGDYRSCLTCKGYVTCANRHLWPRNCSDDANSNLVWDDTKKRCDSTSDTC
uniref:Uncharacterized protein n=1 Tax=Magallana gigas TaxID=29159 RepID=A0A8W8NKV9_MAGGI